MCGIYNNSLYELLIFFSVNLKWFLKMSVFFLKHRGQNCWGKANKGWQGLYSTAVGNQAGS